MLIGSVVVLYNPTADEISNINTYANKVDFVSIIDNSCNDNSEMIKRLLQSLNNVTYTYNHENIGLCKALNQGVRKAIDAGCEWTAVFDADSKLKTDIFQVYKETIQNYNDIENVAVLAPQHYFDRSVKKKYYGCKKVKWAMTSGWLINNAIFEKLNGFFEPLFVDGLDMDYCYLAAERGYKVIECGEAIIDHKPAISKQFKLGPITITLGVASPYRYYLQARCLIWNIHRYHHCGDIGMYIIKWIKVLFFFDAKKEYIKNMIKGTMDGINLYNEYRNVR